MKQLDETMQDVRVIEKILCSLNKRFNHVVVVIDESKNLGTMIVDKLNGLLQAYEEKMNHGNPKQLEQVLQAKTTFKGDDGQGLGHGYGRGRGRKRGRGQGKGRDEQSSPIEKRGQPFMRGRGRGRGKSDKHDKSQV